ncbi:MAG: hypothetical protein Q7S72_01960 [Candidatus Taylorbacteria bacterium]|nr:hypothetical protein [Candidatus Taylorbacteria bacterium]
MLKTKSRKNKNTHALLRDIVMISIGIVIAFILSKAGAIDYIIYIFNDHYAITAFLAGIFFTSIFTLAPSSITLVHIAQDSPVGSVVFWGGLGAMFGDLILFLFIKDRFAEDMKKFLKPYHLAYFLKSLHFGFMRWLSPVIGALIIASPLPDEFGITLLGMSKMKATVLMPIAFIMNMLGIYLLIEFSKFL